MQIRRIVVGLELGKLSDHAITRAMGLAREFGARLDVVHGAGVEAPARGAARQAYFAEHGSRALERAREAARGKLELIVEDPGFAGKPLDDYLHVSPASGAQALLRFAREHAADLIVVGSHRHRRVFDLGGTTRAVLAKSPCPVWMEPAEALRFERVLVPIDLSPATPLVLAAARSLAARFAVPVRVLHVFVPPEFAYDPIGASPAPLYVVEGLRDEERLSVRELVTGLDWGALPVETEFTEGEPARAIAGLAGPTDLVVMGTHGHTLLARAVLGSCADRVLKNAKGPVVVVPQGEETPAAA
jgi:nucleotide-binding universal stress UspA family protein